MCYIAESCHNDGFDVLKSIIETNYDDEWDDKYCIPIQAIIVAHFESNGKIQFFSVSEEEQQQIIAFARSAVLC